MDEDQQSLLELDYEHHVEKRHRVKNCHKEWTLAVLFFNAVFFLAGLFVWARVTYLLKGFQCDPNLRSDHMEPDLLYDTRVTFQPHYYFGGPPSRQTDEIWQRLSPPGDGIVEIPNESTNNLPPSLAAPNNPDTARVYGVSMFHQLHCLNFLRFAYYPETVQEIPQQDIVPHRDHCLDYIRQAIMCAGDSTFEPLTKVGINGMGAVHQCRNFERIYSWAYEHRSDKLAGRNSDHKGVVTHTPGDRNNFDQLQEHNHTARV